MELINKIALTVRFQIVGALFVAVFIPAFVRGNFSFAGLTHSHQPDTMVGTSIAVILGHYFHRRLTIFPGVQSNYYILPTYGASYLAVFLSFFFLRLEYTRGPMILSFFITGLWFLLMGVLQRKARPYRLAVVPGGEVDRLNDITGVTWVRLTAPTDSLRNATGVVVDLRADLADEWEHFIAGKALSGIPIFHVKQIRESLTGRVEIDHLSENTLGSLNPNQAYLEIKRTLDWIGAFMLLILFWPVFLLIALAVKLDSRGPVLFKQKRRGYRGSDFTVYKFRTMRVSGGLGSAAGAGPKGVGPKPLNSASAEWAGDVLDHAITKAGDRRITRVGRFLRRTRLDEFPQIINILRGEMSWVGPRPEALVLSEWYEAELPFYSYRHIVHPGVSGWAQVNQGHVAAVNDVREKLHYDFYYIKNFSLWLDILIILRTIRTMLTGFGSR